MKTAKTYGSGKDLVALAEEMVKFAKACGADEVEVSIADGHEFSVDVRMGEIENLVEAGSKSLGLKVIKDKKTAFAASSDLSGETLRYLVKNAVKRAALANPDEYSGLPPLSSLKNEASALHLFDPEIPGLDSRLKIKLALETEKIALADGRITNSHGAGFGTHEVRTILANSLGFLGYYDQTFCSLSVGLQAGETDNRAEDFWYSSQRFFKNLESPEVVARKAVERTVRQLNPRKLRTQSVPVIFEPTMTSWLLGFLLGCVSGTAVYQKATFLADKLNQRVGNELVTVVDDGLMPGLLGSRPFDAEGVPTRRTFVVERGVLKNYLCSYYAAKKLNLESTGNADGGGEGPNNFYLLPGEKSPAEIIASTEKGLLLIRTIGHGLNPVTGDISRGAFGLWVEKGEILFPVSEITIAGNLGEMIENIEAVGNDLVFQSAVTGPTVKVGEMTIAGGGRQ